MPSPKPTKGVDDLQTYARTHNPQLELEWATDLNAQLNPPLFIDDIKPGSGKIAWWRCSKCNNTWRAQIKSRRDGNNCPYCSNQIVLPGFNDLATVNPELAREWNYEKNGDLKPTDVAPGANRKVWWKCSTCGYEWATTIGSRKGGCGCSQCSLKKRGASRTANTVAIQGSLADNCPELMKEWDAERNNNLDPAALNLNSTKIAWWICSTCGNTWRSMIRNRTIKGTGCSKCNGLASAENRVRQLVESGKNLATICPELVREWSTTLNGVLTPDKVAVTSHKKVWWHCDVCGGDYQMSPAVRTGKNGGCLYCCGKLVLKGFNDLVTLNPELAAEWDPDLNGDLHPEDVTAGNGKMIWWRCSVCGNQWRAAVYNRNKGVGCPECNVRDRHSIQEAAVVYYLRTFTKVIQSYHADFLGRMELDAYVPEANVAVEYDGPLHKKILEKDLRKNTLCRDNGIELIRIRERENPPLDDGTLQLWMDEEDPISFDTALRQVVQVIQERIGISHPVDIDTVRDRLIFATMKHDKVFANSLGIKYPDIASEISSDNPRFGKIRNLPAKSSVKVKWLCSRCGMEWTASIASRTRAGSGCPYCAGLRPIPGRTDLATLHPDIASELCDDLNDGVKADQLTAGSQKILWWNCCRCGKKWKASPYMRCRGQKCPRCRKIPSSASKPIKSSKINSNNASLDDFY